MAVYPITRIALNAEGFERFEIDPQFEGIDVKHLPNLSRVNLFVGENNSGKSRFLRSLACISKPSFFGPSNIRTPDTIRFKLKERLDFVRGEIQRSAHGQNILKILDGLEDRSQWLKEDSDPFNGVTDLVDQLTNAQGTGRNIPAFLYEDDSPRKGEHNPDIGLFQNLSQGASKGLQEIRKEFDLPNKSKQIYIPTLRGLRSLSNNGNGPDEESNHDWYHQRTTADYFGEQAAVPEIFTGQDLHGQIKGHLLGDLQERKHIADFQKYIGRTFFQGVDVALIPKEADGNIHVKIGDEKEYPIHELGDGIQSIILHTFPLFRDRDFDGYVFVFLEEPELYMHPGLQRIFLETLLDERIDHFRFFISTHSNHLLDLTLDERQISVFTFQKKFEDGEVSAERVPRFKVESVNHDDRRTLDLLGVRNSSVFFSNCTVWVEGITDRRYLQHYLELFQRHRFETNKTSSEKPFKEDLHYSFVEYGGGNITHWSFLDYEDDAIDVERLCAQLFLIADRDNLNSKEKQKRHAALKTVLGDRFFLLPVREIENLLTPESIRSVLSDYGEDDNSLKHFTQSDYKTAALGDFIALKIIQGNPKRKGKYAKASGTITDKKGFCAKATKALQSYDDLSKPAKELTETLCRFIAANNPEVACRSGF